jgi:hypothetical protein
MDQRVDGIAAEQQVCVRVCVCARVCVNMYACIGLVTMFAYYLLFMNLSSVYFTKVASILMPWVVPSDGQDSKCLH